MNVDDWILQQFRPQARGSNHTTKQKYSISTAEFEQTASQIVKRFFNANTRIRYDSITPNTQYARGIIFIDYTGRILLSHNNKYVPIGNIFDKQPIQQTIINCNIFDYEAYFNRRGKYGISGLKGIALTNKTIQVQS